MKIQHCLFLLLLVLFASCEEEIDVDLNDTAPALVVEGLITNQPGGHYVKLTKTTSYFDNEPVPPVTGAFVTVTEDGSLIDTLVETQPGIYYTVKIMQGKEWSTYALFVVAEGEVYEASDVLRPVAKIDSLTYKYKEASEIFDQDAGYYVSIYAQEPTGVGDRYRWLYYSNGELADSLELIYATDEFVDGNYIAGLEFFYAQQIGDTVKLEVYSLTADTYEFIRQLDEQDSFGDIFDTPPANIRGNISNGAWGLFQASAVEGYEIIIQ